VEKTVNPNWNETLELGILNLEHLHIDVFDKNILSDDSLGNAKIDLKELTDSPQGFDVKLHGEAGIFHSNHGHIFMKLWITGHK